MPIFQYEAMDASGQEIKAEIEAADSAEAVSKIRAMGYFPTKVKEKGTRRRIGGTRQTAEARRRKPAGSGFTIGRVSNKQLTQFTRQLSTLQDAGLPILRSLRILEQQLKPGLLRTIVRQVADDVEGGATLSEAMSKHPKAFDRLYVNMVQAGETGGVLELILRRLADFMEKNQRLRRRVIGAMIYPIAVLTFAGAIVSLIMIFVIPRFKEIFKDFGADLPQITKTLLAVSDWMVHGGWLFLLGTPIAFVIFVKIVRQFQTGRFILDWIKLRIPVLGMIVGKSSVARFTRTLGTLISAGVPILEAINITRETAGNEVYARALAKVHDAIREGDTFANPLRATKVCDAIVVNMIDVGEETGDLDKMLMKIADNYDEEVDTLVGSLVSLLEPIMVILLGCTVGFIVIALFMPLVKLITTVMQQR